MTFSDPRLAVLVVEDEILVRTFISDFLDEAGFKVFEAVSAHEALAVLQVCPDVKTVVTDVELPGRLSGLALARTIRKRWPGVGLVVSSGWAAPAPDDLPDDVAFLAKPYLPATMIGVIQQTAICRRCSTSPPPRPRVLPVSNGLAHRANARIRFFADAALRVAPDDALMKGESTGPTPKAASTFGAEAPATRKAAPGLVMWSFGSRPSARSCPHGKPSVSGLASNDQSAEKYFCRNTSKAQH